MKNEEPTPISHGLEIREHELDTLLYEAIAEYEKAKAFENEIVEKLEEEQALPEGEQSKEKIQTYQEIIQTMQEIQRDAVSFLESGVKKLKYLKEKREEFEKRFRPH